MAINDATAADVDLSELGEDSTAPPDEGADASPPEDVLTLRVDRANHKAKNKVKWMVCWDGPENDVGTAVAVDESGQATVGVSFQFNLDVTGAVTFDSGGFDFGVGLVRLDTAGKLVWSARGGVDVGAG